VRLAWQRRDAPLSSRGGHAFHVVNERHRKPMVFTTNTSLNPSWLVGYVRFMELHTRHHGKQMEDR
jgi:hypothetical protein